MRPAHQPARRRPSSWRGASGSPPSPWWPTAWAAAPRARRPAGWRSRPSPSTSPAAMRCYYAAGSSTTTRSSARCAPGRRRASATRSCSAAARRTPTTAAWPPRSPSTSASGPAAYLLQVGDSRCYLLRDGELTQITRDQTMAQEMVDLGVMKPAEAAEHPAGPHALELDRRARRPSRRSPAST